MRTEKRGCISTRRTYLRASEPVPATLIRVDDVLAVSLNCSDMAAKEVSLSSRQCSARRAVYTRRPRLVFFSPPSSSASKLGHDAQSRSRTHYPWPNFIVDFDLLAAEDVSSHPRRNYAKLIRA